VIQRQRLEAAEARFKAGAASYMEVLDATRDELSAAQQVSQLRRAELSTATMLYKALGGGVPSRGD
jgi:multidrug efflux system outer membrane protein